MHVPPQPRPRPTSGLDADVDALARAAVGERWGRPLMAIGWCHLGLFSICQVLFARGDRSGWHFLPLWGLDLGVALTIFRRTIGDPGRRPAPPLLGVLLRIWATFFLLCFSVAWLNSRIGFATDWFKSVWATLAAFGFATMAWIIHPAFLVAAVQMSVTGLLIARFPGEAYGIYGASWCLALNGLGLAIERRRRSRPADRSQVQPWPEAVEVG